LNIDTPILVSTPEFQLIHLKSLSQQTRSRYIHFDKRYTLLSFLLDK